MNVPNHSGAECGGLPPLSEALPPEITGKAGASSRTPKRHLQTDITTWARKQVVGVTGGTGVLGRRLIPHLLRHGVTRIVVLSRRARSPGKTKAFLKNVAIRRAEIQNADGVEAAFKECTVVFHLAALAGVADCEKQPAECFNVNGTGTVGVLEACRRLAIRRVVFTSSLYVYGNPPRLPVKEDQPPAPLSIYAASKLAGEIMVRAYCRSFGWSGEIARLANLFGTALNPQTVIGRCVQQAAGGGPIVLRDLSAIRDFIHADDAAEALVRLAAATAHDGECRATNVATGQGLSVAEIANMVADIAEEFDLPRPEIRQEGAVHDAEIPRLVADNQQLTRLTGWKPEIEMQPWLREVFQQVRRNDPGCSPFAATDRGQTVVRHGESVLWRKPLNCLAARPYRSAKRR